MSIFSNTAQIADRFGDYIEELRAILVANNIKFGLPDNLSEFARRLHSDDLLPGDLSRMIESIVDREGDQVSPETILTIIAIAIGGPAVGEPACDLSKPVKLIVDFLIHSGNYPVDRIDNPDTGSRSDALPFQPFDDPTKLIQSLERLELNATQARLYLNSIEQRIDKIEPHLESIPSPTSPPNQSPAPDTDSHVSSDLPLPDFVRQSSAPTREHVAWSFMFARRFAAPPLLATIAGGTLLYVGYHRSSAKARLPQSVSGASAVANQSQANAAGASVPQQPYALTVVPTEDTASPQPKKPSPAVLLTPHALHTNTTEDEPFSLIKPAASHAAQRPLLHPNDQPAKTPQPQASTEAPAKKDVRYTPTHASTSSSPASPRIINVSSGVMAANLLSASPPSYPKLAGLTHMQGKVVMQAIISKDGTVQNLQVIQGHRLLRSAAKNSARTWRYRPYMVNGKPVEVATIVSIDFILGH
jgi:TonB family protein